MSDRIQRLRKALECQKAVERNSFNDGMKFERARTLAIDEALVKCVEALKQCAYLMNKPNFITHDELIQACGDGSGIAFKILSDLDLALDLMEQK